MTAAGTRGWFLAWPAALIAAGVALHVFGTAELTTRTQDLALGVFERLAPRAPAPHPVIHVDIDRQSLVTQGPWPWPRSAIAQLIDRLAAAKARLIVLDLPLAGADPVSATRIAEALPRTADGLALRAAASHLPNPDVVLARTIDRIPVVTRFELGEPGASHPLALGLPVSADLQAKRWLRKGLTPRGPFEAIALESRGVGAALAARPGARLQRVPLVLDVDGATRPSLVLEAARVALGAQTASLATFERGTGAVDWLGRPGPTEVIIGARRIGVTQAGELILYQSPSTRPTVSAAAVLDGGSALGPLANAVVVVSASARPDALWLRGAMGGPALSSGQATAQALEQMLNGQIVERPVWADAGEQLLILTTGLALCLLIGWAPLYWSVATALLAVGGSAYVSWIAFSRESWLLDPVFPSLVLVAALGAGLLARLAHARAARAATQAAATMGAYPPTPLPRPQVRPAVLPLTGEERMATVLVCDIRDFADLRQRYRPSPAALTGLLAAYHEAVAEAVHRNKGAIGFVRGSLVMAYWNGSIADPEHAASACNGALRLIDAIESLNDTLAEDARDAAVAFEPLTVSIGIESGSCLFGTNAAGRFELVPIGDTVSRAEFLVGRSEAYGPAIVVGAGAHEAAQKLLALLEIDYVRLPQSATPLRIFALLGNPLVRASPKFRALDVTHQEIFTAYRAQNWTLARALIHECRKLPAAAGQLCDLYESRIARYERTPPGSDWDGAEALPAL